MPINPVSDDNDISSALNIARQSTGADPIQDKIGGLNQFLTGLDLEANTPQFNTGIGGAGIPSGIPAYQGGPHSVGPEGYDNSKIGTGTGVQAFSHGHYFSENEQVAKSYRDDLSSRNAIVEGKKSYGNESIPHEILSESNWDLDKAIQTANKNLDYFTNVERSASKRQLLNEAIEKLNDWKEKGSIQKNPGYMHEVMIDAHPDHFLDWDKPLSEQSDHIKNAMSNRAGLFEKELPYTGKDLYRIFEDMHGDESEKASKELYNLGIKGVKYSGDSSRSDLKKPAQNYVVFDPKDIEIMRRYARGGDVRAHFDDGGDVSRQPNLVTEDDVAGTWSPRSNPTQGQTVNSYSPATETAPLGFGERLSNALYNRFVQPAISAVTAPGRVYRGEVPEDQMIDEAKNMAGQVMLGSFGVGVPSALREGIDANVLRSGFGGAENPKTIKLSDIAAANNMTPKEIGQTFTKLKKTDTPYEDWSYEINNQRKMLPKGVFDVNQLKPGDVIQGFFGDRSPAGYDITSINNKKLDVPATAEGGSDHALMNVDQATGSPLNRQSIWKSGNSVISSLVNRAKRGQAVSRFLGYDDPNVYGVHVAMGPHAQDFSTHTTEALLGTLKQNPISDYSLDEFNQFMRDKNAYGKAHPDFPDLRSDELRDWLLRTDNGAARIKFAKGMDQDYFRSKGFPEVGPARFATTHPELAAVPNYAAGHMVTHMDMTDPIEKEFTSSNRSYPVDLIGTALGKLAALPHKDVIFPDFSKSINENPPMRNSIPAKYKSYLSGNAFQIVTPEYQDYLGNEIEKMLRESHKKGGRTLGNNAIDNALRLATGGRAHFGFGGDTESDGSRPESGQTGTVSAERSAEAQTQQDNSAAARQDAERASVDNSRGQSAGEQMGQMGRGAGEGNGLAAAIGDSSGGVFGFGSGLNVAKAREAILNEQQAPTDIQDYTTQRLNTPYQGSLLSAAMNPSDAFGMGYGSLVGKQNTRAGAAGFLGSAMGESGKELDPSAINAGSIGMLQETGPRRIGLENTLGIDTSLKGNALRDALAGTQMAQLGYGLNEVQTMPDYRETRNAMATGTNAANVADIALQNFERPTLANQIESAPSREAYAQGIMAGRPSGATLGVGQYDAAPSSFRDALMSGIKQADQQKSRLSGDNTGAMLAGASVSDASNDPAITAARNAAIADGTTPQFNPYAGFSSEDPAEIARYNAAMNAAGPKNAFADMTLGQRAPNTTTNNAFSNAVQGFGNFLTDRLTPSYGINSPEYNKISQAVDVAREPTGGRGDQVYIPPTTATQVQTAPVAPYTTELGTYNQQLPSVGGMTAAQWAAANTAGDMSKVHGRIKYVNGAPMLEYFTQ
jgi:hypothetical protein